MSAGEHLQGKQFKHLYHEAPVQYRESIRSKGLIPNKPFTPAIGEDVYPHGVYMSEPHHSEYGSSVVGHDGPHFGYDRWRVNVEGLPVEKDPDPRHSASHIVRGPVPPERLKMAKKADPNWERNL